jgi:hypothetical protein
MATYRRIQDWVKKNYGFTVKTCWIAHVKELSGLPVKRAHNRRGAIRLEPCPPEKIEPIRKALQHFEMI